MIAVSVQITSFIVVSNNTRDQFLQTGKAAAARLARRLGEGVSALADWDGQRPPLCNDGGGRGYPDGGVLLTLGKREKQGCTRQASTSLSDRVVRDL